MAVQSITEFINSLPSLVNCEKISKEQTENLRNIIEVSGDSFPDELENLKNAYAQFSDTNSDNDISSLDELRDFSRYLSQIETRIKTDWSEKNIMDNQSFLINAVSSVWLAAKKFANIRDQLHSIIVLHCPPACFISTQEIDAAWTVIHGNYNSFVEDLCTSPSKVMRSISKDSLVSWSDKWIDILLDNLAEGTLDFAENYPSFNPYLFTAVKLFSLAGRLDRQCKELHTAFAPLCLPALKSILKRCPVILGEFDMIENLIAKKPKSAIITEIWHNYTPDVFSIDELRCKAKKFATHYSLLSDDVERYLSICNYTKLKSEFDEVFLIQADERFDLAHFEEKLSEIQEYWDLGLEIKLSVYTHQLDFLSVCEKFQLELAKGREFLSKYECSKYEDFHTLNRHKKDIHDFTFSGHWLDSREEERSKLADLFQQIEGEMVCEDENIVIFDTETGNMLMKIIENDLKDFNNLHKNVQDYYETGIQQWKEFLEDSRTLEECISKKMYLLSKGFVKFENAVTFPENVRKVRIEIAELAQYSEALERLHTLGDQICRISKGDSQEFIQRKLNLFSEKVEEMRLQAVNAYSELEPLISKIPELSEVLEKIEDILRETQEKIDDNVEDYKKAKPNVYMDYLKTRLLTLKIRTKKLPIVNNQLEPLSKIESLDITQLESRDEMANEKLTTILEFLSKNLEIAISAGIKKVHDKIIFGEANLDSYDTLFHSLGTENMTLQSSKVTKCLHDLEEIFSNKYFDDIHYTITKLAECSKELLEDDVKSELASLEDSFTKLELSVRSTKILIHFVITYQELDEVLKLRENFIETSNRPSFIADRIDFISNQIGELFGEDFEICRKYFRQLRNRYDEYVCDENQPPMLPLSLQIVSRLESQMRERLDLLEKSFSHFHETFREFENTLIQFRKESQDILAFTDKLESAFHQKENSTIRDSSVLETQCQFWELLIIEGQKSFALYDQSFDAAGAIYDQLCPSPKVTSAKARFPKAKEYLDQLRACLHLYQKYQSELKEVEDRFFTLTNNFSYFYTEMRFPSVSINGSVTEKHDQTCLRFKTEIQAISEAVRSMRMGMTELHGGSHQVVEYSINEEKRLKALEDKLPEWRSKIDGLIEECAVTSNSSSIENNQFEFTPQTPDAQTNGFSSYEIISHESEEDSGTYNLSLGSKEGPLSEEECKIELRLSRWRRWLKKKQKADIMHSDISIKLSEAQIQKREIELTKAEFEKKKHEYQILPSNKENISNSKIWKLYKDVKPLFIDFEMLMSKRCEDVSNRVSSLLEFHLLISLSEKRLTTIDKNLPTALSRKYTLCEQIEHINQLRIDLKECQTECIEKLSIQYGNLARDSSSNLLPVERSPEPNDSLSESDTDEKMQAINSFNSETSSLLSPIPCLEQIQTIEMQHKELYQLTSDHINSLTCQEDTAKELFQQLHEVHNRIQSINQEISHLDNSTDFTQEIATITEEVQRIDFLYAPIEANSALTHDETQLRLEVNQSIDSLKYTLRENFPSNEMTDDSCDSIVPIQAEYIFAPTETEPSAPLLPPTESPAIQFPQDLGEEHSDDSPLKKCFDTITETCQFYSRFTVAGSHIAISEENIVKDIKDKYTQTITVVTSIRNTTTNTPVNVNNNIDSWLDVLQKLRTTLLDRVTTLKETWLSLEDRYDDVHNRISELESEYAAFKSEEGERDELEIRVETAQEQRQEVIQNYNSFSPEMYQLSNCHGCQDDNCQEWNGKLDRCREQLQRLKGHFDKLLNESVESSPRDSPTPNPSIRDIPPSIPTPPTSPHRVETVTKETNTELAMMKFKTRSKFRYFIPVCFMIGIICALAYTWFGYTSYLYNHPRIVPE